LREIARRIGIIGGNGWLGNAIASAAVTAGTIDPARLTLSGRSVDPDATATAGAYLTKDNAELVERSDVVILSVRPDQFPAVDIDASGKLVTSVMAGVPMRMLAERAGTEQVVRSIPNAAAGIGRSFTPWFAGPSVSDDDKWLVQALFEACGDAAEVPQESHLQSSRRKMGNAADRDKVHYRKLHQSILRLPDHPPLFLHGGRFTSRLTIQARHRVQDSGHHPEQPGDGEDCAPASPGRDLLRPANGHRQGPLRSTNLSRSVAKRALRS